MTTPSPDAAAVSADAVPSHPPVTVADTQNLAVQSLIADLAKRALHTFWQTFLGTLAVLWGSSGVNVHSLTHLSSTVKVVIPIIGAAVAAGLSAAKTVVVGYKAAKAPPVA